MNSKIEFPVKLTLAESELVKAEFPEVEIVKVYDWYAPVASKEDFRRLMFFLFPDLM